MRERYYIDPYSLFDEEKRFFNAGHQEESLVYVTDPMLYLLMLQVFVIRRAYRSGIEDMDISSLQKCAWYGNLQLQKLDTQLETIGELHLLSVFPDNMLFGQDAWAGCWIEEFSFEFQRWLNEVEEMIDG